jgi:hypothetical protein
MKEKQIYLMFPAPAPGLCTAPLLILALFLGGGCLLAWGHFPTFPYYKYDIIILGQDFCSILVLAELDGRICSVKRNQPLWEIRLHDLVKELGYHYWFWEVACKSSDSPFDNSCIDCTGALV